MAQPPTSTTNNGETATSSNPSSPILAPQGNNPATRSHGRGGAGNINAKNTPSSTPLTSTDLATPTIKSSTYTTGRGGSGNMAKNNPNNPSEARAAQDVEAPHHHSKDMQGTYHWGRGGEGNMTTIGKSEREQRTEQRLSGEKRRTFSGGSKGRSESFKDAVKEKLGFKKPAGTTEGKNESAVE